MSNKSNKLPAESRLKLEQFLHLERQEPRFSPGTGEAKSASAQEWAPADLALRRLLTELPQWAPRESLIADVLAQAQAERALGAWWQRSFLPREVAQRWLRVAAVLLLLVAGSAITVLTTTASVAVQNLGVAGSAVWSSRLLIGTVDFWLGTAAALVSAGDTVRGALLGEAAPALSAAVVGCFAVALVGLLMTVRLQRQDTNDLRELR